MFIAREAELKFLQNKYEEDRAQLIILYGRRWVGKTETLREFCKNKLHMFCFCTQSTDKVQLLKCSHLMLKEANVMMILCSSAMIFIEKDLLPEKNPLYC